MRLLPRRQQDRVTRHDVLLAAALAVMFGSVGVVFNESPVLRAFVV